MLLCICNISIITKENYNVLQEKHSIRCRESTTSNIAHAILTCILLHTITNSTSSQFLTLYVNLENIRIED